MEQTARTILRRHQRLVEARQPWEPLWQEVATRIYPRQANFTGTTSQQTPSPVYDATAAVALERFAAVMESLLTPRARSWHRLEATPPPRNEIPQVRTLFSQVNALLFAQREGPHANYASQQHEVYLSLGAFGTGCLFVDHIPGCGLRYRAIPLSDLYFEEDHHGRPAVVHRRFFLSAEHAARRWGLDNLPKALQRAAARANNERFSFLHTVAPESEDAHIHHFSSAYLWLEEESLISQGHYRSLPYLISRYVVSPNDCYGRGPAMTVLPEIKMLNEINRTSLRAAHKLVDPPLLLHDDAVVEGLSTTPNALNYGAINAEGRPLVMPLMTGGQPQLGYEIAQLHRRTIQDAFLLNLFQILVDRPAMSATEVLQRVWERGALLAPALGRQQTEALGPMIEREITLLAHTGALPATFAQSPCLGGYRVLYDGPLARSERLEETLGIARTFELIFPLANRHPELLDNFDLDAIVRAIAEANGMGLLLNRKEKVAQKRGIHESLYQQPVDTQALEDQPEGEQIS